MTQSPLSTCPFATPRQLRRWWQEDHLGIAAVGAVGHVKRTRLWWWDRDVFLRWMVTNNARPIYPLTPVLLPENVRLRFTPRKKKPTGVAAPA